jgi:predicted HicB family RNase H-like nuclease
MNQNKTFNLRMAIELYERVVVQATKRGWSAARYVKSAVLDALKRDERG